MAKAKTKAAVNLTIPQSDAEAEQRTVPSGADEQRARAAARHGDRHGVDEFQLGAITRVRQADVEHAVGRAERHLQHRRPVASVDLTSGVPLELEGASGAEVPGAAPVDAARPLIFPKLCGPGEASLMRIRSTGYAIMDRQLRIVKQA